MGRGVGMGGLVVGVSGVLVVVGLGILLLVGMRVRVPLLLCVHRVQ